MTRLLRSAWPALLVAAAVASWYSAPLSAGLLGDDFRLLEEVRRGARFESLGPGGFFRPVSRQVYFALLAPIAGGHPWAFHLANLVVFLAALALLADLLAACLPLPGVLAGTIYFASLPFQRANLTWVSGSQDLLALAFSLGSLALFRRRRDGWAALAYLLAVFSKESALPLPLALAAWACWLAPPSEGNETQRALRLRLLPCAAVAAAWLATTLWFRSRGMSWAGLSFHPGDFAAGYAHGIQSLLGLDDPSGLLGRLAHPGAPPTALVLLAPVALALRGVWPSPRRAHALLGFAVLWMAGFGFVIGPPAAGWSGFDYTTFAVGGALLVGLASARLGPTGWLMLVAGLTWWQGAAGASLNVANDRDRWTWTSRLTPYSLRRAAALGDTLGRQLLALDPRPEPKTRMFFSPLPSWAGFQAVNGPWLRALYRDPSLEAHPYTQFSESTAADHPCRFYSWDGRSLAPLYLDARDRFFQVGSDLLALGRLEGARHAFRRGLAAGENPLDHFYWLGWTELWLLRRDAAEQAWTAFGARDDSVEWMWQMRRARQALNDDRDTLTARRALAAAIRSGIGHPEAHAVLGHLLLTSRPKYGLLELEVAISLKPDDWLARRELVLGLFDARLEEQARSQLAGLARIWPEWRSDTSLARAARESERRSDRGPEASRR